jgi:hypothetical protein
MELITWSMILIDCVDVATIRHAHSTTSTQCLIYNKFHEIHSLVGNARLLALTVTIARSRWSWPDVIYTHSYLLNNEEWLECIPCNSNCSIKHILICCVDVADILQHQHYIRLMYKCRRRHNFEICWRN